MGLCVNYHNHVAKVHSLSSGKVCAVCHAFTLHVDAPKN